MKKNQVFLISLVFLTCTVFFPACEDVIVEFHPDNPYSPEEVEPNPVLEVASSTEFPALRQGAKPFFYEIEKISCTQQGYTLKVLIYQPNNYQYSWIVDEMPAGTSNQIHCVTGKKVYLSVTRYSDMMTISRYMELPPSIHENSTGSDSTN